MAMGSTTRVYIARLGDTLSSISGSELQSTQDASVIASLNPHIRDLNQITEGDFLLLPADDSSSLMCVDSSLKNDLDQASLRFKLLPYQHRQAISEYGEATALIGGVLSYFNGGAIYEAFHLSVHAIEKVAKQVERQVQAAAKDLSEKLVELRQAHRVKAIPYQELKNKVVSIQETTNRDLIRKTGDTFRSHLSGGRFQTRKTLLYVNDLRTNAAGIEEAVARAGKSVRYLEHGGTALVALDLGKSIWECYEALNEGTEGAKECATSLGGFAASAGVGKVTGLVIGGLSLTGAPLVGAVLLGAGAGIGASYYAKMHIGDLYDAVN